MEVSLNSTKVFVSSTSVLATYLMGRVTAVFYLLLIFSVIDLIFWFIVELIYPDKPITIKRLVRDIILRLIQKLGHITLLFVAIGMDFILLETDAASIIGIQLSHESYFGKVTLIYLIIAEGVSIMGSLDKLGVKFPTLEATFKAISGKLTQTKNTKK